MILDEDGAVAKTMTYISLNPVRARIVAESAEYRWSGYGERVAIGKLQESEIVLGRVIPRELGLPDQALIGSEKQVMERVWDRFRESLLGHSSKNREVNEPTVAEILNANEKPLELEWSQRLMLKARFVNKGVAIGSQRFVEDILTRQKKRLTTAESMIP